MDQPQTLGSRHVTTREVLVTFASIVWIVAAIAVSLLYSKLLGGLMFIPVGLAMLFCIWRLTPQQTRQIAEAMHKQAQTPFGQLARIVKITTLLVVLVAALMWAYDQFS